MALLIKILFFGLLLNFSCAYKILLVFPLPSPSHSILGDGHVKSLLAAGHDITYITPYKMQNPDPKLRQIDVSHNIDLLPPDMLDLSKILSGNTDANDVSALIDFFYKLNIATIENEYLQKILKDPKEKFDAVLIEWMFTDLYTGFAAVFNCPFIWFSTVEPHYAVLRLIDENLNPAYNADSMHSGNIPPFGFKERVEELYRQVVGSVLGTFVFEPLMNKDYERLFAPLMKIRGVPYTPLSVMRYNASLMLGNSHVSLGEATRLPQNYKPIGGYHINPDVQPLPEDLKNILDNAKNGLIYFSMGSNLKSKQLPKELKESIVKMFGKLKQTVLWKFEENLPGLPENVHIVQWAPQPSILDHPNCKLFITHGGLLSTTETIHFGVPIIGIPVFGDQFVNVQRSVNKGFALKVELSYDMADDMKLAIEEMFANPKYTQKVKELSLIYHDRPVSPRKELVHWVEHVIRTGGAPHLRSPALMVPWYQKLYLDLAAVVSVLFYMLMLLVRLLIKKVRGKDKKD